VNRKGQVTTFMIIGIVLLAVFAGIYYIMNITSTEGFETEKTTQTIEIRSSITPFIESCIEETAIPGIFLLGTNGGFIYPDDNPNILLTDYGAINYAWLNGINQLSNEKMEQDLAQFIEEYLYICLGDFEIYTQQGFQIEPNYEEISTEINIYNQEIMISLNLPLKITTPEGDIVEIESFIESVETSYGELVKAGGELASNNPEILDLEGLSKSDYYTVIFPYDEAVTIFSVTDEENLLDTAPLTFMFAVRNDNPINRPPRLEHIPDQVLWEGDFWIREVFADDPDNDKLNFSSNSQQFPVSEDGLINITVGSAGNYKVIFTVKDDQGLSDSQEVQIAVEESEEEEEVIV